MYRIRGISYSRLGVLGVFFRESNCSTRGGAMQWYFRQSSSLFDFAMGTNGCQAPPICTAGR